MTKTVFLGGTCNGSKWREKLIPMLTIDYYNPQVENWTEACKAEEILHRAKCDYCLYVITPKQTGFLSIYEMAEDSIRKPENTIFAIHDENFGFSNSQLASLVAIGEMVERNGAKFFNNPYDLANYLNNL